VKEFEFFIRKGEVKRQTVDKNLSDACIKESKDRLKLIKDFLLKSQPKYILENSYEAMREAADSLLYLDGYKSYSHEASIIYLLKKGFTTGDVIEFDRFRKIRNGIKYYGNDCDESDAKSALNLADRIITKINELLKRGNN
jgi:hypothetical protein